MPCSKAEALVVAAKAVAERLKLIHLSVDCRSVQRRCEMRGAGIQSGEHILDRDLQIRGQLIDSRGATRP